MAHSSESSRAALFALRRDGRRKLLPERMNGSLQVFYERNERPADQAGRFLCATKAQKIKSKGSVFVDSRPSVFSGFRPGAGHKFVYRFQNFRAII